MEQDRIKKASEGYTRCCGGLNLGGIIVFLEENTSLSGDNLARADRGELEGYLKDFLDGKAYLQQNEPKCFAPGKSGVKTTVIEKPTSIIPSQKTSSLLPQSKIKSSDSLEGLNSRTSQKLLSSRISSDLSPIKNLFNRSQVRSTVRSPRRTTRRRSEKTSSLRITPQSSSKIESIPPLNLSISKFSQSSNQKSPSLQNNSEQDLTEDETDESEDDEDFTNFYTPASRTIVASPKLESMKATKSISRSPQSPSTGRTISFIDEKSPSSTLKSVPKSVTRKLGKSQVLQETIVTPSKSKKKSPKRTRPKYSYKKELLPQPDKLSESDENLYQVIMETYNLNYLNNADNQQNLKNKINNSGNTIINWLMGNYPQREPNVSKISGPYNLSYHRNESVQIYIFGQRDGLENLCSPGSQTISSYFETFFKESTVFTDFYLEISSEEVKSGIKEGGDQLTPIGALRNLLIPCLDPETRETKCQFKTIRAHYTDVRKTVEENQNFILMTTFLNINQDLDKSINGSINGGMNENKEERSNLTLLSPLTYQDLAKLKLEYQGKIKSEIKRTILEVNKKEISRSSIDNKVFEQFIDGYVNTFNLELWNNLLAKMKSIQKDGGFYLNTTFLKQLYSQLLQVVNVVHDMYTVARMIKVFKVGDNEQPEIPYQIVFYGEDYHAQTIRDFFRVTGFETKRIDYLEKNSRCLPMDNYIIKQPFFQNV